MKWRMGAWLTGILLFGALAPLSAAEGVLLVPRFERGERVHYRMHLTVETKSTLNSRGRALADEKPLQLAFDITWQVEVLEVEAGGSVALRSVIEALEFESSAATPRSPVTPEFVGKAVTYRLLSDGSVADIQAPEEWLEEGQPPAWLRTWLEQGTGTGKLPRRPLTPGETWREEREFEVPGLPRLRLVSESEYLRDEQVGEVPCASILTRFELSGAEQRQEKMPDGTPTRIESRVEGDGRSLSCYDHRNGRVLESTQSSREHIRLEIRRPPRRPAREAPPLVLESLTVTDSHLRVVD